MQLVNNVRAELSDVIKENITEYKADADTMGKNFKRALLGLAAYSLVRWTGPDSNAILETATWVAEKAALAYTLTRAYQTARDLFRYI